MTEIPDEIEMIDRVLEWLCMSTDATKNVPVVIMRNSIDYQLLKKVVVQEFRHIDKGKFNDCFPAIIKKLEGDKYIEPAYNADLYPNDRMLSISFNGILFNNRGGYRGQIERDLQKVQAAKTLRIAQYILAVGIIPPFLWYSLDIVNRFYPYAVPLSMMFLVFLIGACSGAALWRILPLIDKAIKNRLPKS